MRIDRMKAWFDAAQIRSSRRAFLGEPVEPRTLEDLAAACEGFHPFPDARVALVTEPTTDVFTGILGSYGRITGAPHVLCVIAEESSPVAQQHAGYVGEAAVLEATAHELATCWVGGFFDPVKARRLVRLSATERVVAVSPVGYALDALTSSERAMRKMAASHRRKPIERLTLGGTEHWPEWALAALRCARIAPSAVNRQPWRFSMADGSLAISKDSFVELPRVTKALDCGIAMLHAELGALSAGVTGSWADLQGDGPLALFTPQPELR